MLPQPNSEIAKKCVAILDGNEPDKEYRIMCVSVDDEECFNQYKHIKEPLHPHAYNAYLLADPKKQKEFTHEFFTTGVVWEWLKDLSRVRSLNSSHKSWLMDCLKVFNDKKDYERAKKVSALLIDHTEKTINDDGEVIGHVKQVAGTVVSVNRNYFTRV